MGGRARRSTSPASVTIVYDDFLPNGRFDATQVEPKPETAARGVVTVTRLTSLGLPMPCSSRFMGTQPGRTAHDLPPVHGVVAQEPLVVGLHLGGGWPAPKCG